MKKIYSILVVVIVCCFFSKADAQIKSGDWHFDVGPNLAAPIRNLSYHTSVGIGIDGAATTTIAENVNVGGRVNYSYFIGSTPLLAQGGSYGTSVVNITADGSYDLPYNVFVGLDLGAGFETFNGQNDTEFARIFNAGYKWQQSKAHTFIFTLYFDQTTYQKCLGIRAAIRF